MNITAEALIAHIELAGSTNAQKLSLFKSIMTGVSHATMSDLDLLEAYMDSLN